MAFPNTPILDNFNRANANNLGANWGQIVLAGTGNGPAIVSNQVAPDDGTDYSVMYWNPTTFGPNVEAYIDVVTKPGDATDSVGLSFRTALDAGYLLEISPDAGGDTWEILRIDSGEATVVGAGFTQEITNGDAIGMARVGNDIQAWHRTGGVWSLLATRTDPTYVAVGYLAFYSPGDAHVYDNFGGGTIIFPTHAVGYRAF